MKNINIHKTLNIVIVLAVLAAGLSSCSTDPNVHTGFMNHLRDFMFRPTSTPVAPVTNFVPVYASADIVKPSVTNQQTGAVSAPVVVAGAQPTNWTQIVVPLPPATHWDTGAGVGEAQAAAGVIPGYGTIAALGLGLLASIGKAFMNKKEANGYATVATSSFQAIEDYTNGLTASGDPKAIALAAQLKKGLSQAHDYAGIMPLVTDLLDKSTGFSENVAKVAAIAGAPTPPPAMFDVRQVGT